MAQSTKRTPTATEESLSRLPGAPDGPGPSAADDGALDGELITSTGEMIPLGAAAQTVIQWCADNVEENDESQAAAMNAIMSRVLASTSPDQVLAEELSVPVDRVLNKPIQIDRVRIGETEFADGFPYYALLDVVYGNPPERHVVTVGAFKVMAQLFALVKLDAFPQVVMFKKAEKATKAGFFPISMVRPPV